MPAISSFDPYHAWLGIEPHEQPADYYRLLGVPRLEPDAGRIARAADERMALVRSYQVGPRGKHTQKLLNELSAARVCLLTAGSRQQYDSALARHLQVPPSPYASPVAMPPGVLSLGVQFPQPEAVAPPLMTPAVPPPREELRLALVASDEDGRTIELSPPQVWWRPIAAALAAALLLLIAVSGLGLVRSYWPSNVEAPVAPQVLPPPKPETPPPSEPIIVLQEGSGEVTLSPSTAVLAGQVQLQTIGAEEVLAEWATPEDRATWRFRLVQPGFFQAELTYATSEAADEAELDLAIGERVTTCRLRNSGGLAQFHRDVFTLVVNRGGEHTLELRPRRHPAGAWLILKTVRLIPVGGDLREEPNSAGEPDLAEPPPSD